MQMSLFHRRSYLACYLVLLGAVSPALAAPFRWWWNKPPPKCEEALVQPVPLLLGSESQTPGDAVRVLQSKIPALLGAWHPAQGDPPWVSSFYDYLLPLASSNSNQLSIAIVGPANVGKSSVFNSLPRLYQLAQGQAEPPEDPQLSPTGPKSALTVRPRFLIQTSALSDGTRFNERFGPVDNWAESMPPAPDAWNELLQPQTDFFTNLVFIDTPGFDIHSLNPMAARAALISDVIVYVFTGTTYKSDANLQFLRNNFRDRGNRDVILIYRASNALSPAQAETDFQTVAKDLFPDVAIDPTTGLPVTVLGTYVMAEDSRSSFVRPTFLTVGNHGEDLPQLLARLDRDSGVIRRQGFLASLPVVLNGISQGLREVQRNYEEWTLLQKTLDVMIADSIVSFINTVPFDQLSAELSEAWYNRSGGPRNIAQWVAHPLRMARGPRTDLQKESDAVNQLDGMMDKLVVDTVAKVQLAAFQGKFWLPNGAAGLSQLVQEISEFRSAYQLTPEAPPYFVKKDNGIELHLVGTEQVGAALQSYFKRDLTTVIQQAQNEAHEKLADLTIRLQSNFRTELTLHPLPARILRGTYITTSLIPPVIAFTYIVANQLPWTDVRIPASFLVSHLMARLFMHLDERSLTAEWSGQIQRWYTEQEKPRLQDILHSYLMLPNTFRSSSDGADLDRLQLAVEILSRKPVQLEQLPPN